MDSTYIADRLRTMVVVGMGIIGLLVGTSTVAAGVPEGAAFGLGIGRSHHEAAAVRCRSVSSVSRILRFIVSS